MPEMHSAVGLSEIAEEFKLLDDRRRQQGLSLSDAGRYHALFERLSDALASSERNRKVDARQFLRVRFEMELALRTSRGELRAQCLDFGGGGCAIATPHAFNPGDDVWLDGARIEGRTYELRGRAIVVWTRLASLETPQSYGLRFAIDSREMRDQVDRLVYRVLDRFLHDPVTCGPRLTISNAEH